MQKLVRALLITALAGLTTYGVRAQGITLSGSSIDEVSPAIGSFTTASVNGTNQYTIMGGGADIWNASDQFYYAYMPNPVVGDFDYVVRVESLDSAGNNEWAKCELMARNCYFFGSVSPTGPDAFVAQMTTMMDTQSPAGNTEVTGVDNVGLQYRNAEAAGAGSFDNYTDPEYPNMWLRLRRHGDIFYNHYSYDGVAWTLQDTYDTGDTDVAPEPFPQELALGIAVTSHDAAGLATAVVDNFGVHIDTPVSITVQPPATIDQSANRDLVLAVSADGDPVNYQWMKDGVDIAGAILDTLTVPIAQVSDSGTYSVRVYNTVSDITSENSVVTITEDPDPPIVVAANPGSSGLQLTVEFDEWVKASTADDPGNYSISGGITVSAAVSSENKVTLTTSQMVEGGNEYTVTVTGVTDLSDNVIADNNTATFKTFLFSEGFVVLKRWLNLDTRGGSSLNTLTNLAEWPNQPDWERAQDAWQWPLATDNNGNLNDSGEDNYGSQMFGWFLPPATGDYTFYISGDDNQILYLSQDDDPANIIAICNEPEWNNSRNWTGTDRRPNGDNNSDTSPINTWPAFTITLNQGERYYMEVRHQEGGGGDSISVDFSGPGYDVPVNDSYTRLTGSLIGALINPNGSVITINQDPQDATTVQGRTATFTVDAVGDSAYGPGLSYQWQSKGASDADFTDIAGAAAASYTTPPATLADDQRQYRVALSVPALTEYSGAATLTVSSDAIPPTLVSAGVLANATTVGVAFSEALDQTSAETASNYTVNGVAPSAATLVGNAAARRVVLLTVATTPPAQFEVVANGVTDIAGNAIVGGTATGVIVGNLTGADIGTPALAGMSVAYGADSFYVAGGGADIWGTADQMHYLYTTVDGAFSMVANVQSLTAPSTWGKAALMVRENATPGSRNAAVLTTPEAGEDLINLQWRDAADVDSASLDGALRPQLSLVAPYPNAWIRIDREDVTSNIFNSYWSDDGTTWTPLGAHELPAANGILGSSLLVGMAVTSHDNATGIDLGEALYQSFSIGAPPVGEFDPDLSVTILDGVPTISWTIGTLMSSPVVNGTYSAVPDAGPPSYTVPPGSTDTYFQVMAPQ